MNRFLDHPRVRSVLLICSDIAIVACAYAIAMELRLSIGDMELTERQRYNNLFAETLPWLLVIRLVFGVLVRQYTWAFRFASLSEAVDLVKAGLAGSAAFYAVCHILKGMTPADAFPLAPPAPVFLMEFALSLMGMGAIRFLPRHVIQQRHRRKSQKHADGERKLRTLIYGAGHTAQMLLRDLTRTRIYPYHIVGFVDDDRAKQSASIQGVRVLGTSEQLPALLSRHEIDKVLIAIPSLSAAKMRAVVDLCANHHIRFKMVPSYADLVTKGDAGPLTLKDLQLEDLLEREPVRFDESRMASFLAEKTILVTGAAGSIGSEICRQVASHGIRKLIALDINENDLHFLHLELKETHPTLQTRLAIVNIREPSVLQALFDEERPDVVFHAAAHKHVPLMEACPPEALKNNILGTCHVARAASQAGAERFVLISTDKAVRPTSVMGATKQVAEGIVSVINRASKTHFMTVRFGNVLGSNGSLIQILQRQIAKGGPITITHPDMMRFFMTIPEAVGLVLVAAALEEGELCVLEMGEQLNVDRLARQLITLYGLIPDVDIAVDYIGLRPGEKMYEELATDDEALTASSHPKIRIAHSENDVGDVDGLLREIEQALQEGTDEAARRFLAKHVTGWQNTPASAST